MPMSDDSSTINSEGASFATSYSEGHKLGPPEYSGDGHNVLSPPAWNMNRRDFCGDSEQPDSIEGVAERPDHVKGVAPVPTSPVADESAGQGRRHSEETLKNRRRRYRIMGGLLASGLLVTGAAAVGAEYCKELGITLVKTAVFQSILFASIILFVVSLIFSFIAYIHGYSRFDWYVVGLVISTASIIMWSIVCFTP